MGKESAEVTREITLLEEEKKSIASNFTSRISEKEARRSRLSNSVSDGFEFREILCDIKYNSPKDGLKQVVRKDNGEVVEELPMNEQELQEELEFKAAEEEKAEAERKEKTAKAGKEKSKKRQDMKQRKAKEEQKATK